MEMDWTRFATPTKCYFKRSSQLDSCGQEKQWQTKRNVETNDKVGITDEASGLDLEQPRGNSARDRDKFR